jgi:filamentous hemagglutinin
VLGAAEGPDSAFLGANDVIFFNGDLQLQASRDITVEASLARFNDSIGGALSLDAGRSIDVDAPITDYAALSLRAAAGDVRLGASLSVNGAISVEAGGSITQTAGSVTGDSVRMVAGGDVTLGGSFFNAVDVTGTTVPFLR